MNNIVEVKFVKTHPDAILPYKNHMGNVFDENGNEISVSDTGYDLTCVEDIEIEPRSNKVAPVGLSLGYITPGYWIRIESRSGNAFKKGVTAFNGIIDNGYRGDLSVLLFNNSDQTVYVKKGDRVGQLVIYPIITSVCSFTDVKEESARGEKGFGSSGHIN